jgi:hypothetical protein
MQRGNAAPKKSREKQRFVLYLTQKGRCLSWLLLTNPLARRHRVSSPLHPGADQQVWRSG